ncbi:MAG: BCCT family transporter [Microlunatus sp.]|nr:BCCT family transporter [Microlunatus sp.]MDN5770004.1 BCCT family transporter [Microlunatus sp.]
MSTSVKDRQSAATQPSVDRVVMTVSAGILVVFVATAIAFPYTVDAWISDSLSTIARWFGLYWEVLLLATFVVAILLAFTPWAKARMGGLAAPEYSRFKWIAMIMCTLLAGGGVFWAAAEPMYHFLSTPPHFEGGGANPTTVALAQSFAHWGFLAWAILGSLGALVMLYGAERGMPLRPRTLLYPLMGKRILTSWIGSVVDIVCIIAVVAGTVGPIGFLGLQVAYGLNSLFGIPNVYVVQLGVIVLLSAIIVASVLSGLDKGIQILSRINVWMALALMALVLIVGSATFVLRYWLSGLGTYATDFVQMTLYQGDQKWLSTWTIFFFGWFMGYGPLMAIFIARISRGRTARDLLISTAVIPPIATTLWFAVLGGTGIWVEQQTPGAVSQPLSSDGLPAAVMAIAQNLPLAGVLAVGFLLLTITFVATTGDSMSFAVAQACTRTDNPPSWLRAMWALIMGAAAAVLISIGDGGISALQSFIVITAVPVGFVLLPTVVAAPIYVRRLAIEQRERTSPTSFITANDKETSV